MYGHFALQPKKVARVSFLPRWPEGGVPLYVSGNLPTYPSPKPTFYPKLEVSVNVGLGKG